MASFNISCRECTRLAAFLDDVRIDHPDYFAKPVPPFGAKKAKLLIVGLAPGMHGGNRTGRPFTGDPSGILLYETMHEFGFASKSESLSATDNLKLLNCRITNAVKCLPPQNKPTGKEINQCNKYLVEEIEALAKGSVILALGSVAHNAVLKALKLKLSTFSFGHNVLHKLNDGSYLLDSYHCSRYNTQTKRLTTPMFRAVFRKAKKLID